MKKSHFRYWELALLLALAVTILWGAASLGQQEELCLLYTSCRRNRLRGEIAEAPPAGGKLCEAFGTAVAPSGELYYTAENAAAIPCRQVLGVYSVSFPRQD